MCEVQFCAMLLAEICTGCPLLSVQLQYCIQGEIKSVKVCLWMVDRQLWSNSDVCQHVLFLSCFELRYFSCSIWLGLESQQTVTATDFGFGLSPQCQHFD